MWFDSYQRPAWTKDGGGFLTYTAYDNPSGAATKGIADVDTTQTSTFSGLPSGWATPSGGGSHLTTALEVDALGNATKVTAANGNVSYATYNYPGHESRIYAGWDSSTNLPTGPTLVTRSDWGKGYSESLTMSATPGVSGGRPTGAETISGVQTLSREYLNVARQAVQFDVYFDLAGLTYTTSTTLGSQGVNFHRVNQAYDNRGRPNRTLSAEGTIYRSEHDGLGRPTSAWVGTDDTPTAGFWSPTNTAGTDLVKTSEYEYDGGGVGSSNLTAVNLIPGGGAANELMRLWYDWRDRAVAAKSGLEVSEGTSVNRPLVYYTFDNLDQVTKVQGYDADGVTPTTTNGVPDAPSASLLRSQAEASYDELGRAYQTKAFGVDPSSGSVSSGALTTNVWRGKRGEVVKVSSPGGLVVKDEYDGAGRRVKAFATDGGGDTGYSDADDVTGDKVLEQVEVAYDASGNVLLTTARQRFHDETGTGALVTPTTEVKARVSYGAQYYDKADRVTASVNVGSNGGSAWSRPSTVPTASDTVLVTAFGYDAAGRLEAVLDPKGIVSRMYYDDLGQTVKTIANYIDGTPSDADDKTTEYAYNGNNQMTSLTAKLTSGYQTTAWVYGTSAAAGDGVTSYDLLKETQWPNPSTGDANSADKETRVVNALGQLKTYTDRNSNVHTLTYDVLGRLTVDAVTTLGSGVDGAVRRLEIGYDSQGNAHLFTSYDAAAGGNVVNQVQRAFNGLSQLTTEWQEHGGSVNTSTSPKVQYSYTEMASGANHSRLLTMTYPNGKVLTYNYTSGLDADVSRLSSLSDTSGTLESYDYLGLATVVRRAHSQPGVDLTYIKQTGESDADAGDKYTGLDRFGRVVDQRWLKTSTGVATDRHQYGYDRDSNRLWLDNLVNSAFGEVYQYDNLNQLTSMQRGTLNGTKTGLTGAASRAQSWDFDALGNWDSVTTDSSTQTRSHNKQNEITSVSGATTPTYDANGNLTKDETGRTLEYDAWNRLVRAKNSGGTTIAEFKYDAMSRRVSETKSSATTDLYYSASWQVLKERDGGSARVQYTWSPAYVDAMVLRDRDTDANGSLDERLWVQQDANFNVTALVNGSGTVVERFAYDAFGNFTVYDANWAVRSGGSAYGWLHLHQGLRYDATVSLYDNRWRWYDADLGRFATNDPLRFAAGDVNLVRYLANSSLGSLDPSGLENPDAERVRRTGSAALLGYQSCVLCHGHAGLGFENLAAFPSGLSAAPLAQRAMIAYTDWKALDAKYREGIKQTCKMAPRAVLIFGMTFLPGGGEALDILVLRDPNATPTQKKIAVASLVVNLLTLGFFPNYGAVRDTERRRGNGADAVRVSSSIDDISPLTGGRLSDSQAALLGRLDAAGGRLTLRTGEISTTDMAALTRHRDTEFALIRTCGGERQLLQLNRLGGNLPRDTRRLIAHSHPPSWNNRAALAPSGDDLNALQKLSQNRSLIVNAEGTVAVFHRNGESAIIKQYLFGSWLFTLRP